MPIELSYEKLEDLPEAFRTDAVFNELFTKDEDGKITLTGVTGMKSQKDVDALNTGLKKEREEHKKTKEKFKAFGDQKPDEILAKLDRITELELAAGGKLDEESINKIVESRIVQKTAPLERTIKDLTDQKTAIELEFAGLKTSLETRDRNDFIRSFATESKAHATALSDIEMAASQMLEKNDSGNWVVKEGIQGLTPGLDPKNWLKEMTKLRPHWWPESQGGGSRGVGGVNGYTGTNPFTREGWNMTEQGKILKTQGRETADNLAKAAGTTVGGGRPPAKK